MMAYTIDRQEPITTVRFHATPDIETLRQAIKEIDLLPASYGEIWDIRKTSLTYGASEMQALGNFAKNKKYRPVKTAILTRNDISYPIMRMYSAHRAEPGMDLCIFGEEEKAIAWILSPPTHSNGSE